MVTAALLVVTMRVWNLVIDVYLFKPIDSGERNKYLCTTVLHVLSVRILFHLFVYVCMCTMPCAMCV